MHASREKIMSEKSPNFSKILTELKKEEVEFEQREQKEEGEITGSDDEEFDYPSVFRFRPNRIVSSPAVSLRLLSLIYRILLHRLRLSSDLKRFKK